MPFLVSYVRLPTPSVTVLGNAVVRGDLCLGWHGTLTKEAGTAPCPSHLVRHRENVGVEQLLKTPHPMLLDPGALVCRRVVIRNRKRHGQPFQFSLFLYFGGTRKREGS